MTWKSALRRLLYGLHLGWVFRLREGLRPFHPWRMAREPRFRRWNRGAAADEMVVRPGLVLRVDPQARGSFEWFCFRSAEMTRELDAFCREMPSYRRFLDVGACHGIFSLVFAHRRPEVTAVAIEPSTVAFRILAANAAAQEQVNVVPRQIACGAAAGTLRMRQVWHHLEAVAAGEPAATTDDGTAVIEAPMSTVDALCREMGFQPDLMKIDVEGYEMAVLLGAQETLALHRPRIFLEVHPERLRQLGHSVAEVVQLLEGLGYGFFGLGGGAMSGRRVARLRAVSRLVCGAAPPGG